MKVIFMGTPDFAVGALESIIDAGHEVVLAVTQPDKPKGRGKEMAMPPIKECAVKRNIPVFQPHKIRMPEAVEELKKYDADVFVVAAFGQILTKEILDMPKYGCINIHASLLPDYKGAAPISWVVLNGEEKTGVTIMQMDEGLDTGDMILQEETVIEPTDTADSLFDKLSAQGAKLIVKALADIESGVAVRTPQPQGDFFYAKMLKKEMGELDFTKSTAEVERYVRGLYSWPGAYTYLGDKVIKVLKAGFVENAAKGEPGSVSAVTKNEIRIFTGDGEIALLEVKPQGKKEMTVHDFLLGNHIKVGTKFGRS